MKRVIVTGDDFGLARPVNEAIEEAHRNGILTAASLMVGAEATEDAVARARRLPSLAVGLHVVLVEGRPLLPAPQVSDLVDEQGEFSTHLVRAGVNFFFRPRARAQLRAEIRAQFQAFQATGLRLDHANAHNHMHLHPTVLALIVEVGREFDLGAMRVPCEPPLASWHAARTGLLRRLLSSACLFPWIALLRRRLRRAGLKANRFAFGLHDTGNMHASLVERFLAGLPDGVTEMYFHPATGRSPQTDRFMADYRQEAEFEALTSPSVRQALQAAGAQSIAFADI
jgi:hopanoid biosynthesis associated protein HpnK